MTELPDFLRGVALIGKYGENYIPIAVDASGQLYIVLTGAPSITIPGNVNVNDLNTVKQIQGFDGATWRAASVDAEGRFVMVPIGASGYYLNVDAAGNLTVVVKGFNGVNYIPIAADASGNMVAVIKDPASGQIIAVDANGFITAVLKGSFGGTLKTIALDDSGRMIGVMADVNAAWGYTQNLNLADLGAALGQAQRWDRRGKIFDAITFETGIPDDMTITKAGAETTGLVPGRGLHGDYCLAIGMKNVAGTLVLLRKFYRTVPLGRFGVECSFSLPSNKYEIRLYLLAYTGAYYCQPQLVWDTATSELYYVNAAGGGTSLAGTFTPNSDANIFVHMKMVVDFSTYKYVRALWNELAFDLSAQSFYKVANAGVPRMEWWLQIAQPGATAAETVYVDDFIVTIEEP